MQDGFSDMASNAGDLSRGPSARQGPIEDGMIEHLPALGCNEHKNTDERVEKSFIPPAASINSASSLWFLDLCMHVGSLDCVLRSVKSMCMWRSSTLSSMDAAIMADEWFKLFLSFAAGQALWVPAALPAPGSTDHWQDFVQRVTQVMASTVARGGFFSIVMPAEVDFQCKAVMRMMRLEATLACSGRRTCSPLAH